MGLVIQVSKLDAAERQLLQAIKLFFQDEDPVCIHALAAASCEVLEALLPSQNISHSFITKNPSFIKGSKEQKNYHQAIFDAKNFFKHANKDPDRILRFNPIINQTFILQGVLFHSLLSKYQVREFHIYRYWFEANNQELAKNSNLAIYPNTELINGIDKASFFKYLMNNDMDKYSTEFKSLIFQ